MRNPVLEELLGFCRLCPLVLSVAPRTIHLAIAAGSASRHKGNSFLVRAEVSSC